MRTMMESHATYGFIVADGNGYVMARVTGGDVRILARDSVELPKKQSKGGQSAQRFGRIRQEKILA